MKILLRFTTIFIVLIFSCGQGFAHEKVIIVPLNSASGDAQAEDVLAGKTFSNSDQKGVVGTRPPVPIAKTRIGKSEYANDDGDYAATVGVAHPAVRFEYDLFRIVFGLGTIDHLTGLSWQATPTTSYRTWSDSIDYCEGLATGILDVKTTDWRLPNINELISIMHWGNINPPLDDAFSIGNNDRFWTSTPYAVGSPAGIAWTVYMNGGGEVSTQTKTLGARAMCVRGPDV